jgi:outer membrane receptor protein involved in Fe transport
MPPKVRHLWVTGLVLDALLAASTCAAEGPAVSAPGQPPAVKPQEPSKPAVDGDVQQAQQQQPEPLPPVPQPVSPQVTTSPQAAAVAAALFGGTGVNASLLSQVRQARVTGPSTDIVLGVESQFRTTTDAADLLGKSTSAVGTATQKRSPIITDPRIEGSSIGQLIASGSYWFPVRQDLDTILSKIDSREIGNAIIIKGPYSALYGPGFSFIDLQLLESPRFQNGFEIHGNTGFDFKTNGQQWYGRQAVYGGDADWGFRVVYGHRTGNDYEDGNGVKFPSSYNSRNLELTLGKDLSRDSKIEFSYLRLDQTGVELPEQVVDITFLVTDAFEVKYTLANQVYCDALDFDVWYNSTRFAGNANGYGKRQQLPFLDFFQVNLSDGTNQSTGFKLAAGWGRQGDCQTTAGVDLRYLTQVLNQFSSTDVFGPFPGFDFNQPIPFAHSVNPGLFVQQINPVTEKLTLQAGGRLDFVQTDAAKTAPEPLDQQPFGFPPLNIPPILTNNLEVALGGGSFDRSFLLGSAFVVGEYKFDKALTPHAGAAFAMRPPTMTELYSVGTFATVLPQYTITDLIGNPKLKDEKRYQLDLGFTSEMDRFHANVNGYFAWVQDYITLDRIAPQGFFMAYTNTDLATLAGVNGRADYQINDWVDSFILADYVKGRDLTRAGNAIPANRYRSPTSPRSGVFSNSEPLPVIAPPEARIGLRIHQPCPTPAWGLELSWRIVAEQDEVATSLGELPTAGFNTIDARAFWHVNKSLTCVAGVLNLTDRHYQEHFDSHAQAVNEPVPLMPGVVIPAGTTLSVFQPGITFYFGMELTY